MADEVQTLTPLKISPAVCRLGYSDGLDAVVNLMLQHVLLDSVVCMCLLNQIKPALYG